MLASVLVHAYPQDYFRNPLNIPILLAGNFGECRPGHFHSGIDIKTQGKENLAVYAAAEGYISRIKMEPGGFGHALYITHPNGYVTLYAHLNDFVPALQQLVRSTQYKQKNWEMDLSLAPGQFPVKKGEQIAWSGNTGGSTAPHLHFEIRDSKNEHPLNPLLFGLPVTDKVAPVAGKLALYDMGRSLYEQDPLTRNLKKTNTGYGPERDTIVVSMKSVGLGLYVNDYMEGSDNTLSIYTAAWYLDDQLQGSLLLDDIGYDETRYLNACADYKTKQQTGTWFNSLFLLPGNKLQRLYTGKDQKGGVLLLPDNQPHRVRIELEDAFKNKSTVSFIVRAQDSLAKPAVACATRFPPNQVNKFEHPNVRFVLDSLALYDTVCMQFTRSYNANDISASYQVHQSFVPVHKYFSLGIKPDKTVPFSLIGKIALIGDDGKSESGSAAKLSDGWYSASVRAFGKYRLVTDTVAPTIVPLQKAGASMKGKKELRFRVRDNYTSVKSLRGTLNGQWLCFERHGSEWFYRFDKYCPAGKQELELTVIDENENERKLRFPFVR
jgi:hypothetical protein